MRLRVSPQAARIVAPDAPRELQLNAARGALPLADGDQLTVLLFLCHGGDPEVRAAALETARDIPGEKLLAVTGNPGSHPQLLDFLARVRLRDLGAMETLLANPAVSTATLVRVAAAADSQILSLFAAQSQRLAAAPEVVAALCSNPRADRELKLRLGWRDPAAGTVETGNGEEEEAAGEEEAGDAEVEEVNLSKYQLSLQMEVAQKIKKALTGDKEWRAIFTKDPNKLVCSAVLKNPRITEGEVQVIAKNKGTNDEMIRLITLNREWIKSYEIQKALVLHPRTPLPKALRYMNVLTVKDLKHIAKSRNVAQVIANNARRMLLAKEKKH